MSNSIHISIEPVRTIAFGAIRDGYNPVGGLNSAFSNPCRILLINNLTNANLMFSDTGSPVNGDKFPVAANTSMIVDLTTNKTVEQGAFIAEKTSVYVKNLVPGVGPTAGAVYVTVFYGEDY